MTFRSARAVGFRFGVRERGVANGAFWDNVIRPPRPLPT